MTPENKDGLDWSIKPNKPLIEDSEKPFVAKSKMFSDLHMPDYIIDDVDVDYMELSKDIVKARMNVSNVDECMKYQFRYLICVIIAVLTLILIFL